MQNWDKSKTEKLDIVSRQTSKKKKTGRWCRGKVGVEHVTALVINHNMMYRKACRWFPLYWSYARRDEGPKEYRYTCMHSYRCTNCGKYVEYFLKNVEECPNYVPKPVI